MKTLTLLAIVAALGGCECKKKAATTPSAPLVVVDAGTPVLITTPDAAPPAPPPADRATCCTQCTAAASQDQSGYDISISPCTKYIGVTVNDKPALDDGCSAFFSENADLSIGECRGGTPAP